MTTENDKSALLATEIYKFVGNTVLGHERGMYRVLVHRKYSPTVLTKPNSFSLFTGAALNYFNGAYKSLVLRDDPYVVDCFDKMHKIYNHSYICLLNIVFKVYMETHSSLDRSKLDVTSLETFEKSVRQLLHASEQDIRLALSALLNHECHGQDISKCDPNETMFTASTQAVIKKQ